MIPVPHILSWCVFLVGGVVLVGWVFDIPALKSLHPDWVTMKANTALGFVLAGLSLGLAQMRTADDKVQRFTHTALCRKVVQGCTLTVSLIGFLTLVEYLFQCNLGIDQLLFQEATTPILTSHPGRMAVPTAFNFLVFGIALLFSGDPRRLHVIRFFSILGIFNAILSLAGYLYGIEKFRSLGFYTPMALHTSLSFILLGVGIFMSCPVGEEWKNTQAGGSSGQILVRKVMAGFIAGLLILIVIGAVSYRNIVALREQAKWMTHTQQVLDSNEKVFSLTLAIHAGSRGFILTQNPVFPGSYHEAIASVDAEAARLCSLVSDNPIQQSRVTALRKLISKRVLFAKRVAEMRLQKHFDEAEKIMDTGEGQRLADEIQKLHDVVATEERRLLQTRDAEAEVSARNARWIIITGSLVAILFVSISGYMIWRNFTARELTEMELVKQMIILKSVLANISAGVIVADSNGKFFIWNRTAEYIVGSGPKDITPQEWSVQYGLFLPDQVTFYPTDRLAMARAIRGESVDEDVMFLRNASMPQGVWLSVDARPLIDENGRSHGGVVIFNDITERRKTEEEIRKLNGELKLRAVDLEATNKELESFCHSISHDLRAPLRHIDGFMDMLQQHIDGHLDDKGRHYMAVIAEAAQNMSVMIDELLAFSRRGRMDMLKTKIDFNQLCRKVISGLELEIKNRKIDWQIDALPPVHGDSSMLHLVWANLIGNAVKYTGRREKARIEIGCKSGDPNEIIFFIRDNGVGFEMQYVNKLFGVFQRLHRTEEFHGTGIGLANVRRIIQRHGGRTWAEGEVEKGATFYFSMLQTPESDGSVNKKTP